MSVAGSQLSAFKAPNSIINGKRSMLDASGFDIPLSYNYKYVHQSAGTDIIIKVPQQLQTYVTGDKQINVRYVQILDQVINLTTNPNTWLQNIIRVKVVKQQNNIDINGVQTQVIGYLTYDLSHQYLKGECQLFEQDSKDQTQFIFEKYDVSTQKWNPYYDYAFIYIDVEVQYDYNQNN